METKRIILEFKGSNLWLSNFYLAGVFYGGMLYPTAENAYQAAKSLDDKVRETFMDVIPGVAKRMGRRVELRPDWEDKKLEIMKEIVTLKFTQNPDLKQKLLATGDTPLFEGNTWGDTFWGIDLTSKSGQNHLGKILMEVRSELMDKYA